MDTSRIRDWAVPAGLFFFAFLILLPGSGSPSQLTKGDVYTFVFATVMGMIETGNYLTPLWNTKLDFSKPPLFHWILAGSLHVFKNPFFAFRLPPILCSCGAILLIYAFGRLLGLAKSRAALAGLIFLSCAAMVDYGRQPLLEAPLLFLVMGCFYSLTRACLEEEPAWLLVFGASLGASAMTKWIAGPVTVGLYAFVYVIWSGSWRWLSRQKAYLAGALLLAAALALTWPAYIAWRYPYEFRLYMYWQLIGERYSAYTPLSTFMGYIALGFAPWTLLLLPALARLRRLAPPLRRSLGSWVVGVIVPTLMIANRSSRYAFPAVPALCLAIAALIDPEDRAWAWSLRSTAVLAGTCLAVVLSACLWMGLVPGWIFALGLLAAGSACAGIWAGSTGSVAAGACAIAFGLMLLVGPAVKAVGFNLIPRGIVDMIGDRQVRRFENLPDAASTGYLPLYLGRRVFIVDGGDLLAWNFTGKCLVMLSGESSLANFKETARKDGLTWTMLASWRSPHTHPRAGAILAALRARSLEPLELTHYLIDLRR